MKEILEIFKEKGIATAEDAMVELERFGILTGYDCSKYAAANELMRRSYGHGMVKDILEDVAFKHSIGSNTLKRVIEVAAPKLAP